MRFFVAALIVVAAFALAVYAGTPPPAYQDVSLTMTNAWGGVGRTQGYKVTTNATTAVDLLASASMPTAIRTELTAPAVSTFVRFVRVELVCTSEAAVDGGPNTDCELLGPTTDDPLLTCGSVGTGSGVTGGCYLKSIGDFCEFTIRPITQCTAYADCHGPLWAMNSPGDALGLAVSVAW